MYSGLLVLGTRLLCPTQCYSLIGINFLTCIFRTIRFNFSRTPPKQPLNNLMVPTPGRDMSTNLCCMVAFFRLIYKQNLISCGALSVLFEIPAGSPTSCLLRVPGGGLKQKSPNLSGKDRNQVSLL